jgi:putative tricarboxylic transport membrane protein
MEQLLQGFATVLTPMNLLYCFIGTFLGTVVGILPGIGPLATIGILLPLTFKMDVTSALLMLCGIYYGVAYGGTATSVLLRVPGEASSVVTCLDGYAMARKGRAGPALAVAAIGSQSARLPSPTCRHRWLNSFMPLVLRNTPPSWSSVFQPSSISPGVPS